MTWPPGKSCESATVHGANLPVASERSKVPAPAAAEMPLAAASVSSAAEVTPTSATVVPLTLRLMPAKPERESAPAEVLQVEAAPPVSVRAAAPTRDIVLPPAPAQETLPVGKA